MFLPWGHLGIDSALPRNRKNRNKNAQQTRSCMRRLANSNPRTQPAGHFDATAWPSVAIQSSLAHAPIGDINRVPLLPTSGPCSGPILSLVSHKSTWNRKGNIKVIFHFFSYCGFIKFDGRESANVKTWHNYIKSFWIFLLHNPT